MNTENFFVDMVEGGYVSLIDLVYAMTSRANNNTLLDIVDELGVKSYYDVFKYTQQLREREYDRITEEDEDEETDLEPAEETEDEEEPAEVAWCRHTSEEPCKGCKDKSECSCKCGCKDTKESTPAEKDDDSELRKVYDAIVKTLLLMKV